MALHGACRHRRIAKHTLKQIPRLKIELRLRKYGVRHFGRRLRRQPHLRRGRTLIDADATIPLADLAMTGANSTP
jgi:hypothetical protein